MTARAQLLFVLLLLPLAACATARLEPGCADNAMCAARAAEPRLLTQGRAERQGGDLVLVPVHGERQVFTDNKQACDADDAHHCTGFALMGDFPKSNAWVVQQFYYEGGDFLLVDDRSGRQIRLNGTPFFSSDGGRFLIAPYDDENDVGPNNLEIWRRDGDGAVLEWAHPVKAAYQEDPSLKELYEARVMRWDKDQITLAFSEPGTQRHWSGMLMHDKDGWHLSAKSP
jgi:hypothetical protein